MKKNHWYKRLALCALAVPCAANSQDTINGSPIDCDIEANQNLEECIDLNADGLVEEIIVTGTYLKRDKFTSPSPIEVITNIDVQESGAATIGEFIRDANYSLNASTINAGGGNGADTVLNLRGFGTDGTLTLVNGVRATTALDGNSLIPDIALSRAEVLLDGGGALYGADAIAGVVNLISTKRYEGVKTNVKYNSDLGDYEDSSFSILAGTNIDFLNMDIVQSFETQNRSTLSNTERPEYLAAAVSVSANGNPGTFDTAFRDSRDLSADIIDPMCGFDFFNGTAQTDPAKARYGAAGLPLLEDGSVAASYADLVANGGQCYFAQGEQDDYLPKLERYVSNTNLRMDITEDIELNYSFTISYRDVLDPGAYSSGQSDWLVLPESHPAVINNPVFTDARGRFGSNPDQFAVSDYRPFGKLGTKPSGYNSDGTFDVNDETRQYNHTVTLDYDIGATTWSGQTYASTSARTVARSQQVLRTSRLAAAFQGLGGPDCGFDTDQLLGFEPIRIGSTVISTVGEQTQPIIQAAIDSGQYTPGQNGCQYFNPLLSEAFDPTLSNSPELLEWLHDDIRWMDSRTETRTWETRANGELFNLPAGPVGLVVGYNFRDVSFATLQSLPEQLDDDFDNTGGQFLFQEIVQSPFMEIGIPILDNLSFSAAVRREEYKDRPFGSATIPKYSISYQPFEDLAIRASYGESFTAPRAQELDTSNPTRQDFLVPFIADPFDNATALFSTDVAKANDIPGPTGRYTDTGNADLEPETSETINIGFTYRGLENWEFSIDLQEITYIGRITTIRIGEKLARLQAQFDAQGGDYTDSAGVIAFLNANPIDGLIRDTNTGQIIESFVRPSNTVDDITFRFADFKIRYNMDTSIGFFSTELSATGYDEYKYVPNGSSDGALLDAVGQRNDVTSAAVAIPRWKSDLYLRWSNGNHRIVSRLKHITSVDFDGNDVTTFAEAPDKIKSFLTTDLRYAYQFEELLDGQANITIGATNLFDKKAHILPVRGGIEPSLHDPYGRRVFLEMNYEF